MAAIRANNTKPEIIVRKYLWNHGFRYRLNHPRLPGKPDIVMRKYRTCIFVNGCFWHGHEGCKYYTIPKTNTDFWVNKVKQNQERDIEVQRQLSEMGWRSITIWECELKGNRKIETLNALVFTLSKVFLKDHSIHYPDVDIEENIQIAAEP